MMKNRLFLLMASLLVCAWSMAQSVYCCSRDGYVNVRAKASASSKIIGRMEVGGQKATWLGQTGKWCKVRYNGVVGYVHRSYVVVNPKRDSSRKVYYVVHGSYDTFAQARHAADNVPQDFLELQVYKAEKDGVPVYRLCSGCYATHAQATEAVKNLEEWLMSEGAFWVWESDGIVDSMYVPWGYSGEDNSIPEPHLPR